MKTLLLMKKEFMLSTIVLLNIFLFLAGSMGLAHASPEVITSVNGEIWGYNSGWSSLGSFNQSYQNGQQGSMTGYSVGSVSVNGASASSESSVAGSEFYASASVDSSFSSMNGMDDIYYTGVSAAANGRLYDTLSFSGGKQGDYAVLAISCAITSTNITEAVFSGVVSANVSYMDINGSYVYESNQYAVYLTGNSQTTGVGFPDTLTELLWFDIPINSGNVYISVGENVNLRDGQTGNLTGGNVSSVALNTEASFYLPDGVTLISAGGVAYTEKVPEPAVMLLLGLGLMGLAGVRRKFKK